VSALWAALALSAGISAAVPPYSIEAIRYATVPQFPVSSLVMGAPEGEKLDIAVGTFKSRLNRASAALRAALEADERTQTVVRGSIA